MGQGPGHLVGALVAVWLHRTGQRRPWRPGLRALSAQPRRKDPAEPGSRADVRRRFVLMRGRAYHRADRRRPISFRARRLALTAVAAGLVVAAEALATLSARPLCTASMHRILGTSPGKSLQAARRRTAAVPRFEDSAGGPGGRGHIRAPLLGMAERQAPSDSLAGCDTAGDPDARTGRTARSRHRSRSGEVCARRFGRHPPIPRNECGRKLSGRPIRLTMAGRLTAWGLGAQLRGRELSATARPFLNGGSETGPAALSSFRFERASRP